MRFGRVAWIAVLAVVAAAAYAIYSPETTDRLAPALAGLAHRFHGEIWTQQASGSGQAQSEASGQVQPVAAPITVSVTAVKRADFPLVLEGLGQVQAYNTVVVRARVDGQIEKIAFKEGQMVKEGDLLAEIDPRPLQAALDQATAKKAQDEANLANAKLDLARYATLAKQSFATQQQLDTQNSLVNQLTASIAADAAAIDAAKVQLDYTTIRAPISGRVGFRLIDEGNLVNAAQQTGIVSIAQIQPISVIFTEPQEYVDRINQELAAGAPEVTVMNAEGAKLAIGKLTISDNQVDVATGTIRLKAEFENKDNALWPGLAVTTDLAARRREERPDRPRRRRAAWAERAFRLCRRRSKPRRRPKGEGRASERVDRGHLGRPEGGGQGRDGGRVPASARIRGRHRRRARELAPDVRRRFRSLHPPARRHHAADGRDSAGRPRRVSVAAGRAAAAGRFSDHLGHRLAARRLAGNDGCVGRAAARAPDRPDSGRVADDVDELARRDRRSPFSSISTATSTPPPTTSRPRSTPPRASCRRTCRARRPIARSIRPTRRS